LLRGGVTKSYAVFCSGAVAFDFFLDAILGGSGGEEVSGAKMLGVVARGFERWSDRGGAQSKRVLWLKTALAAAERGSETHGTQERCGIAID
jgi:hypothetical protein